MARTPRPGSSTSLRGRDAVGWARACPTGRTFLGYEQHNNNINKDKQQQVNKKENDKQLKKQTNE
jgi:hypothetical protein